MTSSLHELRVCRGEGWHANGAGEFIPLQYFKQKGGLKDVLGSDVPFDLQSVQFVG